MLFRIYSNILLLFIGIWYGTFFTMSNFMDFTIKLGYYNSLIKNLYLYYNQIIYKLIFSTIVFPFFFIGIRNFIRYILHQLPIQKEGYVYFKKYDSYIFLPLLLIAMDGIIGVYITPFSYIILSLAFYCILIFKTITKYAIHRVDISKQDRIIPILFFISGFSSLIYQIVWQRFLFSSYGGHTESITIIVSIFMLGIGMGSLLGGMLSKVYPNSLTSFFLLSEIIIGVFGIFSPQIIVLTKSSLLLYSILLIPTICMGATLPILVEYLNQSFKDIGQSVSLLYFVNTIGSAIASIAVVNLIFVYGSLHTACYIAAFFNFIICIFVYRLIFIKKERTSQKNKSVSNIQHHSKIKHPIITLIVAMLSGFIGLGQEIIWIRTIGYLSGSQSAVFGNALSFFLIGSAFGSLSASKIIASNYIKIIGYIFISSSLLFYLSNPFIAFLSSYIGTQSLIVAFILVTINSFLIGLIFPLLCRYAILHNGENSGLYVSRIYFMNIIGSVLGPIVITFCLYDYLSIESIFLYASLFSLVIAFILFTVTKKIKVILYYSSVISVLFILIITIHPFIYSSFFEKLYYKESFNESTPFKRSLQNQKGILNIIGSKQGNDVIINDGVEDGSMGLDPYIDPNNILPCYLSPTVSNNFKNILILGNTILPCTTLLSHYKTIQNIDVLELRTNYLNILPEYPYLNRTLKNEKIHLYNENPRTWITQTNQKYDFILFDAPLYSGNHSTHLLSSEFLILLRSKLETKGVLYINNNNTPDIVYTAASIFQYMISYANWFALSDTPFTVNSQSITQKMQLWDGTPLNQDKTSWGAFIKNISYTLIKEQRNDWMQRKNLFIITDDNLATEFKIDNKYTVPDKTWVTSLLKYKFTK